MIIEYLNGPNKGQTEVIISDTEINNKLVYITESGKELPAVDLNKVFRIKSVPEIDGNLNFAELGDPSLIGVLDDVQPKDAQIVDRFAEENKKLQPTAGKLPESNVTTGNENITLKNPILASFFTNAKLSENTFDLKFTLDIPTKEFYTLINGAIDVSNEDFIDLILKRIDVADIKTLLGIEILKFYTHKTPKTPKTPKK